MRQRYDRGKTDLKVAFGAILALQQKLGSSGVESDEKGQTSLHCKLCAKVLKHAGIPPMGGGRVMPFNSPCGQRVLGYSCHPQFSLRENSVLLAIL